MPELATESDLTKPRIRRLKNEVVPFGRNQMHAGSVGWIENPDPVLSYVAQRGEEEYQVMERAEPAILAAKNKRINTLLAFGTEVQAGNASKDALELKEWSIAFFKRIKNFSTVQRMSLSAIMWGWRPMECLWDFEFRLKGKNFWGVRRILEKTPQDFRFDENRTLLYVKGRAHDPIVFDRWEDDLHWLICTGGSTNNPYGEAVYRAIWLIYYVKQRFMQMWSQGMSRSLGTLKFKQQADPGAALLAEGGSKSISEIAAELREVLRTLNEKGVLIERYGWALEMLSDIEFAEGWDKPLKYCDEVMTLCLTGETLSMRLGDTGSRAAAQVHRDGLLDFCKSDAKELESWYNDDFLHPALRLNFGDNIPEEILPRLRSKIHQKIDIDAAQKMFNMGAPIDGVRLAQESGVPLAIEESDSKLRLVKPEPMPGDGTGAATTENMPDPKDAGKNPPAKPPARNAAQIALAFDDASAGEIVAS